MMARLMAYKGITGCTTNGTNPFDIRNFLSQTTSFAALEVATYSTSVVELAMQDYFTLL